MSEKPVECSIELSNRCLDHIFVFSADNGFVRVAVDDITHLRAERDSCTIFIRNSERMLVTVPMKHVLKDLPQTKFIRVHRSHALKISHIVKIMGNHIELQDGTKIDIGRTYRDIVLSRFIFIGSRERKNIPSVDNTALR